MTESPKIRVLVVDDDPKFRVFAVQGLEESGYAARAVGTAEAARHALGEASFDVVLLDVMMPGEDGTTFLKLLRAERIGVPVIFVTARGAVDERVHGLRLGADDYVVKPFSFAELLARVDVVVRRRRDSMELEYCGLRLDVLARQAVRGAGRVDLSPKEFDLLRSLVQSQGAIASREALLRGVWHLEHDPGTNVVEVHIRRLRQKLATVGGPVIETVRGQGYRLCEVLA